MRLIRFVSAGRVYLGRRIDETTASRLVGDPLVSTVDTGEHLTIDKLLAPIVPTDILCIGLNYRAHAAESKSQIPENPMLFIKASNALNHPGEAILIPRRSTMIDYEGELAVVIGRDAKNVSKADALGYVFGYTIANDVSARDWQREKNLGGGQFARGKSFDGFCPLGPDIVTADEIPNPNDLMLQTKLNGEVMQNKNTSDMIFDVATVIESLSSTMTIRAGSVILTGTPEGVGFARTPPVWLMAGDNISIEIEKIGLLENTVEAEA